MFVGDDHILVKIEGSDKEKKVIEGDNKNTTSTYGDEWLRKNNKKEKLFTIVELCK